MASESMSDDERLPGVLTALDNAIRNLCYPRHEYLNNRVIEIPSLYHQLLDAIAGEQVNSGGGRGAKSKPPLWIDALTLIHAIDTKLAQWQPAYTGTPATIGRLHWLNQRHWRPHDVHQINDYASRIQQWAVDIDRRLNPPRITELAAACPNCEQRYVLRRDELGESTRTPALHIVGANNSHYCQCLHCHYVWEAQRFPILAGALGCSTPQGVLE